MPSPSENQDRKIIRSLPIPPPLIALYQRAVTIISEPSPPMHALTGGNPSRVPFQVVLRAWKGGSSFETCIDLVREVIHTTPCHCARLMEEKPILRNSLGHVVARTPDQWKALLPPHLSDTLTHNARNRIWNLNL